MTVLFGGGAFPVLKELKLIEEETEKMEMEIGVGEENRYPEISNFSYERL